MTLWLLGNKREKVPPLRLLSSTYVEHFDGRGRTLSKMRGELSKGLHVIVAYGYLIMNGMEQL